MLRKSSSLLHQAVKKQRFLLSSQSNNLTTQNRRKDTTNDILGIPGTNKIREAYKSCLTSTTMLHSKDFLYCPMGFDVNSSSPSHFDLASWVLDKPQPKPESQQAPLNITSEFQNIDVCVEVGSGMGSWVTSNALLDKYQSAKGEAPQKRRIWLSIDQNFDFATSGLARNKVFHTTDNCKVIYGDPAHLLSYYCPSNFLSSIFLTLPVKAVMSPSKFSAGLQLQHTQEMIASIKPGGHLYMVTQDKSVADELVSILKESEQIKNVYGAEGYTTSPIDEYARVGDLVQCINQKTNSDKLQQQYPELYTQFKGELKYLSQTAESVAQKVHKLLYYLKFEKQTPAA